ncbi:hypothetical protein FR943_01855 [Mycobacterium sp. TNTM28]|uniref:Uncharacterized protein n=1 Tax=[Mycobacterium] fortunisiensis TaxID=2600579 RepID=A0ABS6KGB0_9MYCO|nr:hypothetical protein [[Mycobacterium] fortunisiensis]MBU9762598.1 hypothetical protein [[Mycobacterium] fortunisiensis]
MTRAQRSPAIAIANSVTDVARGWAAKDALAHQPGLWQRTVAAARAALAAVPRPQLKQPYYPPPREGFVEDAAMAREMWRL